jgi:hypothetical protein
LGTADSVIVFAFFIVVASVGMAAPVILYLVAGKRAARTLDAAKSWLVENNATVMMVVFLVLASVLVGKGIAELA